MRLTPEQQAAVQADAKRVVLHAGAGSGKTSVIAERYHRLVTDGGLLPEQVLTITFTRRAAAEMKERIVAGLRRAGRSDLAQRAETGPIQTVHGFCERLLRENAFAAGIDPQFDVLEGADSVEAENEAVRWAYLHADAIGPEAAAVCVSLSGRSTWTGRPEIDARLRKALSNVLDKVRSSGRSLPEWLAVAENLDGYRAWWARALAAELPESFQGHVQADAVTESLKAAFKQANGRVPEWLGRAKADNERAALEQSFGLLRLGLAAWERIDIGMAARQAFDFTAMESMALRLLETDPEVAERTARQYPAALIDEAQDLNPVQYRLIEAVSPGSTLFVGDPQQSIFGFRQADTGLFAQLTASVEPMRLGVNHRSVPKVLGAVDHYFGRRWSDAYAPMISARSGTAEPTIELWPASDFDTRFLARETRRLWDSRPPGRASIALLVRYNKEATKLAEAVRALDVPCRVLGRGRSLYTRMEVRDLANALEALTEPENDFAHLALAHSPLVGLSTDAVAQAALNRPIREALLSGEAPTSEDAERLRVFREWFPALADGADQRPAWELIAEILARSPYLEALGRRPLAEQPIGNVRKVLTLAAAQPETGTRQFAAQVREIQRVAKAESEAETADPDEDAVDVITVHGAKGLEWSTVVVADAHFALKPWATDCRVEPGSGLVSLALPKASDVFAAYLAHREAVRHEEEETRLLYVAMTRARDRLCLVVDPDSRKACWAQQLARAFGVGPESSDEVVVWPGGE